MQADWDNARKEARKIVSKYDIKQPPVNVFEIAEKEGIEVVFFSPDFANEDVSGLIQTEEKKVYLNAEESPQRQAFTLAHELAHYFLKHQSNEYGVNRRDVAYANKLPKEKEADMFAAELLMPAKLVNDAKKQYHLGDEDALVLARLFAVSKSAMQFRLKALKSKYGQEIGE